MGSIKISHGMRQLTVVFPQKCPICHAIVDLRDAYGNSQHENGLELGFVCPNPTCTHLFIAYYNLDLHSATLANVVPAEPEPDAFPELIQDISPTFVQIYGQSLKARSQSLDQIAGPGFRKAFEFLVKDYAKSLSSDSAVSAAVESAQASQVVGKYIPDPRIQSVARRALWLGNDETHYLRKWTDHDIDDLLTLIRLTINWIEIERLSKSYVEDMPEPDGA